MGFFGEGGALGLTLRRSLGGNSGISEKMLLVY